MRGILTVLEGIDGCGKGVQSTLLRNYLIGHYSAPMVRHYPTYDESELGKLILQMLKGEVVLFQKDQYEKQTKFTTPSELWANQHAWIEAATSVHQPMALQALFAADRYQMDIETRTCLNLGRHAVFDRYYHSGMAFGVATGVDQDFLIGINSAITQPDLAILLEISPQTSLDRRPERRDKFEQDPLLMQNVSVAYRQQWDNARLSQNYWRINGEQDPELIHAEIVKLWEITYARYQDSTQRTTQYCRPA